MIELIDCVEQLTAYPKTDLFSVRIRALALAYGCGHSFVRFYIQTNENGNSTAILSYLDNDCTLSLTAEADKQELTAFLAAVGYDTLLCSNTFEMKRDYRDGAVMKSVKCYDIPSGYAVFDEYPKLMDLFNFLDYEKQDFESWYVDLNHRIRHGTAKAFALTINDEIVSSGILSSITQEGAVLTAVRTQDAFRHMGYGSMLVKKIVADCGNPVYLMREQDKNEEFYRKTGFVADGNWRMYK